jgi:hypothetical protein
VAEFNDLRIFVIGQRSTGIQATFCLNDVCLYELACKAAFYLVSEVNYRWNTGEISKKKPPEGGS